MQIQCGNIDELLQDADLVITGEGQSDRQTLMGKAPYGVLQHARSQCRDNARVCLLCGSIADADLLHEAGFDIVRSINEHDERPLSILMRSDVARQNMISAIARL